MVLIMVLMAVTVMMVFSIGIVSRGVSQVVSSEEQIDRIRAEQFAIGAYAKVYSDRAAGAAPAFLTYTATMDNKLYMVNIADGGGGGINNTNTITITAVY
jgi:hypothetical protein